MGGLTFDIRSFSRRLQEGGFTQGQAETLATEQARLIDDRIASKEDVARIVSEIEQVRIASKGTSRELS